MTKQRMQYVYHLVGVIESSKRSNHKERIGYLLKVNTEQNVSLIQAWSDKLTNPQIWTDLENNSFLGKKYLFHCQNWMGHYRLINWEQLDSSSKDYKKEDHA